MAQVRDVFSTAEGLPLHEVALRVIGMVLVPPLAVTVFAQAVKPKPRPAPATKPLSEYMRQVGLSYLEKIDDLKRECDQRRDTCGETDFFDRWDRTFEAIEDRVTITLGEPRRPAGDEPFFRLLKNVRHAAHAYVTSNYIYWSEWQTEHANNPNLPPGWPVRDDLKKKVGRWRDIFITCQVYAHSDALAGTYATSDDEQCESRLRQQVEAEFQKEMISSPDLPLNSAKTQDEPVSPKEAEARSWHTQPFCEKAGFAWKDGQCHAQ